MMMSYYKLYQLLMRAVDFNASKSVDFTRKIQFAYNGEIINKKSCTLLLASTVWCPWSIHNSSIKRHAKG